jgi:hypothetical protein
MPRVGFEPTISVFEQAKTFHASDKAATVIGRCKTVADEVTALQTSHCAGSEPIFYSSSSPTRIGPLGSFRSISLVVGLSHFFLLGDNQMFYDESG